MTDSRKTEKVTDVDTAGVSKAANNIEGAVGEFVSKYDAAKERIAALGACWGDDKYGKGFAQNYVPSAQKLTDQINSFVQVVEQHSATLRQAPGAFQSVDAANAGK